MHYRTHTCGELRNEDVGKEVVLSGWVHSIRQHGNISFIDLRDRHGRTQVVLKQEVLKDVPLRKENVITISGKVIKKEQANKSLATGEVEVHADSAVLVNPAEPLPLDENASEETRLKYRYLDLRREEAVNKLKLRHDVAMAARDFLSKHGFLEIETPLLVKSTPEGARDYVVPSRVNKGKFYALPQSPQLYKQILMIAGVDRYFQLARCLRDEDLRADRQPEHTQIDLEMSFMTSEEIRALIEKLFKHIFKKTMNVELDDFETFTYRDAMNRYGSDKPDIRFGLELHNINFKESGFEMFKSAEIVKALVIDKELSRKDIDELTAVAKVYGAKGLAYAKVAGHKLDGGVAKFLSEKEQEEVLKTLKAKDKETVLFVADKRKIAETSLGQIRVALRDKFSLVKKDDFKFVWIVDFPLFSWNEDEQRWEPEHHMFSMPKEEFVKDFEKRPGEVLGDLYDITMNGLELGSGSIRVSNPALQKRIMNFIGIDEKQAEIKFGFLLEAYKYGAPTHGGMGLGLDRTVALMAGTNDIREVIAFPKNKNAECPMDGSPSFIDDKQLDELGLNVKK
ncbi:MAG: aspartate--tRNA ligase [Candidatus Nanoarchaeia archaeon]